MSTAHTTRFTGIVKKILLPCCVSLPGENISDDDIHKHQALLDTGATSTCVSLQLAADLKLVKVRDEDLKVANNQTHSAEVYCVQIRMGNYTVRNIEVYGLPMEGTGKDVIIGMDIISKVDLSITNYKGQTVLTFRAPSLETIDYVEEIRLNNKCLATHQINTKRRIPDKCACGSGKEYKNCHGKSVYNREDQA